MRVQEKGVRKKVPIPMNMHFFDLKVALFWTLCNKTEKRNCAYLTKDEKEREKIQTYAKKVLLFQKQSGIIQISKNLMRKR